MKLIVIIAVLGLLGWLAWDKFSSHFRERFSMDQQEEVQKETVEATVSEPPPRPAIGPSSSPPLQVHSSAAPSGAQSISPILSLPEPPPEAWVVVERDMKYPVQPELIDFLKIVSAPLDRGSGGQSSVYYDAPRSRIFVSVPESKAAHVNLVLDSSDQPPRQVTVEVCVVLANLGSGEEFGVTWLGGWSPGRAELAFGSVAIGHGSTVISSGPFEVALTSAVSAGAVTVVSRPSVGSTLGTKASISSGREVGLVSNDSLNGNVVSKVEFKDVSLSIEVTVFPSGPDYQVSVIQRNDELAGTSVVDGRRIPEIATQLLETSLMLKPSLWASAGSVLVERDETSKDGWKWLPPSQKASSNDRQEIGVFVRVLDGLLARPVQPSLRAEPVSGPSFRAEPVKRGLFRRGNLYVPPSK